MPFEKIKAIEVRLTQIEAELIQVRGSVASLVERDEQMHGKLEQLSCLLGDNRDVLIDIGVLLNGIRLTRKWAKVKWPTIATILLFRKQIVDACASLLHWITNSAK